MLLQPNNNGYPSDFFFFFTCIQDGGIALTWSHLAPVIRCTELHPERDRCNKSRPSRGLSLWCFFFFFVDTSCQTGADSISPSVRPPERAATVSRKTHENHTACDAQRPVPTCTRLQGQSAVPCKTPHARRCGRARVRAYACVCVCSVSTQGHTQAYSSAISQSRNKHRHDNSDARFGQDHSK